MNVGGDIPMSVQQPWLEYRQLLRDLPDALKDVAPAIVLRMFPAHPDENKPNLGDFSQSII